jgi:hypothetical protein
MVTEDRLVQPLNNLLLIAVTDDGMLTEVRLVQPTKAPSSIEVTELEISSDVSEEQFPKL